MFYDNKNRLFFHPRGIFFVVICLGLSFFLSVSFAGKKTEYDPLKKLRKQAKKKNGEQAQYQLGSIYLSGTKKVKRDYVQAVYWFSQAAKKDHPLALYKLGLCYEGGIGIDSDKNHALMLYKKAAENEVKDARIRAGVLLMEEKQYQEAAAYFKQAVAEGDILSSRELGRIYLYGLGIKQDISLAFLLLSKAAHGGDAKAHLLLSIYYSGDITPSTVNSAKMVEHLWESAIYHLPEAQSTLGYCYEKGIAVRKNTELAVKWYRRAAEKNYPSALVSLANCYFKGKGIPMDSERAFVLYQQAATSDYLPAFYNLAICYMTGRGTEQDDHQAKEYLLRAAESGNTNAQYTLGATYQKGQGEIPQDLEKAFYWYNQAAQSNDPKALRSVGFCFLHGIGTPINTEKASQFFSKASASKQEQQSTVFPSSLLR